MASFKLNHALAGFRPAGFHAVNVLLHCAATALVVRLGRLLLPTRWAVGAAGALFAAHPVHTEAVAGIVGRADLMACNFYLIALLAYAKHVSYRETGDRREWPALVATLAAAMAALLSKETGATALLICGVYDAMRALCGCRDKVSGIPFFRSNRLSNHTPSRLPRSSTASHTKPQHSRHRAGQSAAVALVVARTANPFLDGRQSRCPVDIPANAPTHAQLPARIQRATTPQPIGTQLRLGHGCHPNAALAGRQPQSADRPVLRSARIHHPTMCPLAAQQ